jgi:serine/threonine protein kinase
MQLVENLVVAGRFRLNRLIGRGGMGSVWQATHLGLDIPCAVKFIEGEFAGLAEAQARFEREAKAAAQLRSPHVVQILDHGVWENTPYIAMELLEGEDLGKRLTKLGTLPMPEINTIIQQVARALTKAHQAGIVHRDLKPDNIFLVRDDDREIVKVLDFGIAKKNSTGLDTGNNTKTGAMLGTPYYMSPEQAQGTKGVDWRSDLWSLAVIVFQMVTGRLPFESEALGDLLVKIIVAPVPLPSQVASVPPQFDRWWQRAADREPARRYQSAKEFADALAMTLGQSTVTDVMDRNQIGGTALMPNAPNLSPNMPTTPNAMANTPNPHQTALLATPNPAAHQGGGGPPGGPMQQTPYPGQAPMQGVSGNTTGAPLAKSFNGGPAGVPKKSGAGIAIALGGAALVVAVGIGGVMMMKGKKATATGGTTTATVAATASPPPPVDIPPPVDPIPVVATAPGTGAAASASATAAPPPVVAAGGGGTWKPPPPHAAPNGGGAPKPSAKPAGPAKPADLGF